jgi:arginase family enzyme
MPAGINNLRIGEAILQGGRDTFLDHPWTELQGDVFTLSGELLEVKVKPSMPIGKTNVDAFGQKPQFVDEGDRLRGIANIGREDVIAEGLTPLGPGIRILGASSDHLVLDLTEASPTPRVGDRLVFRMNYGAMLAVMTSEYVEKVPVNVVQEERRQKLVSISSHQLSPHDLPVTRIESALAAIGYRLADAGEPSSLQLTFGSNRNVAWPALAKTPKEAALGLIWIDARAAFQTEDEAQEPSGMTVLSLVLARLRPQISPENVVLVGLRDVDPEEAQRIRRSRVTAFTIVDIDARGIRDVMNEAIRIAMAGTSGYHVFYGPEATDMRGWPEGIGGLTVRETHQAMEAIACKGSLVSFSTSGFGRGTAEGVSETTLHFVLSALGKQIL